MTVVDDETMNYILSEQEERDNQKILTFLK